MKLDRGSPIQGFGLNFLISLNLIGLKATSYCVVLYLDSYFFQIPFHTMASVTPVSLDVISLSSSEEDVDDEIQVLSVKIRPVKNTLELTPVEERRLLDQLNIPHNSGSGKIRVKVLSGINKRSLLTTAKVKVLTGERVIEEKMLKTSKIFEPTKKPNQNDSTKMFSENNLAMKEFLTKTISKKKSSLECPVCYQVSSPPIYRCLKEHLICSNCLPRINNKKCPTCRSGFAVIKDEKISRLAEENWRELQEFESKLKDI